MRMDLGQRHGLRARHGAQQNENAENPPEGGEPVSH